MRARTYLSIPIVAGLLLVSGLASSDQSVSTNDYMLAFFDDSTGYLGAYAMSGARQSFKYLDTSKASGSVQGTTRTNYETCNNDAQAWDDAVATNASQTLFVNLVDRMTSDGCDAKISTSIPSNPIAPVITFAPIRH